MYAGQNAGNPICIFVGLLKENKKRDGAHTNSITKGPGQPFVENS